MPEYKRFKLDNFDSTREMLELLDTQRLIISDMEKENEELKKENEELKERVKQLQIDNTVIKKRYETLISENGELKNKIYKLHYKPPIWFTKTHILKDKNEEEYQR